MSDKFIHRESERERDRERERDKEAHKTSNHTRNLFLSNEIPFWIPQELHPPLDEGNPHAKI